MPSNEEIRKEVEKQGYILLDIYTESRRLKVSIEDKYGYRYEPDFHNLRNGHPPCLVGKNNSHSLSNISMWVKNNNCNFELWKGSEYVDSHATTLKFYCYKCNDVFRSCWANISNGSGCGVCDGIQIGERHSLWDLRPDLCNEWSNTNKISPKDVTLGSCTSVAWMCSICGYIWNTKVCYRTTGDKTGCPACAGKITTNKNSLVILFPEIAAEWHPTKNGNLKPSDVTCSSSKNVWWLCKKCGSEWDAKIPDRTRKGSGCPVCAGKRVSQNDNLVTHYPEAVNYWDYDKNDRNPEEYRPGSYKEVYWLCENGTHESFLRDVYRSTILDFRCPECSRERTESILQEKWEDIFICFQILQLGMKKIAL
jgi:hypothetical protein